MVPANGWSEEKAWEPAVGESGQSDYPDRCIHELSVKELDYQRQRV